MKKTLSVFLAASMIAGMLTGCGGGAKETEAPDQTSEGASAETKEEAKAETGEKQKIEFWYHAADEESSAMFEEIFAELNASQDKYEYVYTGFARMHLLQRLRRELCRMW